MTAYFCHIANINSSLCRRTWRRFSILLLAAL